MVNVERYLRSNSGPGGMARITSSDRQSDLALPASLAGKGTVNPILTVENQTANTVDVAFK